MKQIKVPTPRQLPSGSWFLQISVKGQRISITEATEQACIARAIAVKQELLEPEDRSQKPTLSVCIDRYIEARKNVLSPATITGYRVIQRNRFSQAMQRSVTAYGEDGWQRLVNREANLIGAKSLQNAWGLVSAVLYEETGKRFSVRLPQVISQEKPFLEPEQIQPFVEAIHGEPFEIPALLALCSLRRSELLALTWDQIDLKQGLITVAGAMVANEAGEMVRKKENKNRTSRRVVPIMIPQLRDALQAAKDNNQPLVTVCPSAILRGINRTCAQLGYPQVGIHGLRHTFASLAYHLGMPEKVAMQIGGWQNDATMRKIYTHVAQKDILTYQNKMTEFYSNHTI